MKTLYEGILKGMDKTLAAGDNDTNVALNADLIGIASDNKKEQEKAVNLFKQRLKDLKVKPTTDHMDMYKSTSWWVQFKEHEDGYELVMFKSYDLTASNMYIIYIDKYGKPTKWWRVNHFNAATTYFILGKPIYEVPKSMDAICDKIFKTIFIR